MKNYFVLILSLAMFLAGCGDSSSTSTERSSDVGEDSSMRQDFSSSSVSALSSSYTIDSSIFSLMLDSSLLAYLSSSSGAYYKTNLEDKEDALNADLGYDEFVDARDGHVYKTVDIAVEGGVQTWMAQNLNYEYEDGKQSWCANGTQYDSVQAGDCEVYGRLYSFASLFMMPEEKCGYEKDFCGNEVNCFMDCDLSALKDERGNIRGICPEGFHLPSREEFSLLGKTFADSVSEGEWIFYGAARYLMADLKWDLFCAKPAENLNEAGFSAIPAGSKRTDSYSFGNYALFWSATEQDAYRAYSFNFAIRAERIDGELKYCMLGMWKGNEVRKAALSVRCIKD